MPTMDYTVMVNTSSINGTTGSIDFQFNPGVGTFQSANVNVASFNGGSYGGAQSVYGTGVAGGPPPTAISITNVGGQDNEVLDSYTFGNALTFTLDFSGPAVNAPNGTDTAGSLFAFSIFGDAAGTMPVLTSDPNGVALTVAVSDQGVLTPTIVSPDVQLTTGTILGCAHDRSTGASVSPGDAPPPYLRLDLLRQKTIGAAFTAAPILLILTDRRYTDQHDSPYFSWFAGAWFPCCRGPSPHPSAGMETDAGSAGSIQSE